MPTYDYECKRCDHRFEAFHSMTAAPLKKCPECGRRTLRRLIGAGAGLIFKGSGFYITDYKRNGSDKSRPNGSESSSSDSQSADSKSSDSKSTDSKSTDSKSTDSKSSDTKSTAVGTSD